jgi:hypothetical protein
MLALPPPPPTALIPAIELGEANGSPRLLLQALGLEADPGGNYSAAILGQLAAALGGRAAEAADTARALQPRGAGLTIDPGVGRLCAALAAVCTVNPGDVADAAAEARELSSQVPPAVPTPPAILLGDALRRALLAVPAFKQESDSADELADHSDPSPIDLSSAAPAIQEASAAASGRQLLAQPRAASASPRPFRISRASPSPSTAVNALVVLAPPRSAAAASAALRGGHALAATPPALPAPMGGDLSARARDVVEAYFPARPPAVSVQAMLATAGGTPLRVELARLNDNRPLLDSILGADSFDTAQEALHDIHDIEARLAKVGAPFTRPPRPVDIGRVASMVGELARAVHAARHLTAQPAPPPPPLAPAVGGTPEASAPHPHALVSTGHQLYGASGKLPYSATATAAIDLVVIAPLLTRQTLIDEYHATPLQNAIDEAERLCKGHGAPAVAYHLSSGSTASQASGEHLPLSFIASRAATWKAITSLVAGAAQTSTAAATPLSNAIASLSGISCALLVPLLGGHAVDAQRGKARATFGTTTASTPGTLVGVGARFSIPKAVEAFAVIVKCTIGRYAGLPCETNGPLALFGLPALARKLVEVEAPQAVEALDDFFNQLSLEADSIRSDPEASTLDIAGLVAAFTQLSLPVVFEEKRLEERLAKLHERAVAARAASAAASTPDPLHAALLAAAQAPAGLTAPTAILPPIQTKRALERAKSKLAKLAKAAKGTAATPATGLASAAPAPAALGQQQQQAAAQALTAAAAGASQYAGTPAAQIQQTIAALQASLLAAAKARQAQPAPPAQPPPPAPAAGPPLGQAQAPAAAAPAPAGIDINALVQQLPITSIGSACQALDRVVKATTGPGSQWPCAMAFLFGACHGSAPGAIKPCRRCSDPRPASTPPLGTRPAIKAACSDPTTAAKIIAGG